MQLAEENCQASRKFLSVLTRAYFRNGPNAAASITATLIRPYTGHTAVMPYGWEGNRRFGSRSDHASQIYMVSLPTGSRLK